LAHEGGKVVVTDIDEEGIADCAAAIKGRWRDRDWLAPGRHV
jgi:hypothetical protein